MEGRWPHWRCQASSRLRAERPAGLEGMWCIPSPVPAGLTFQYWALLHSICLFYFFPFFDVLPHLLLHTQPWPVHLVDMKKRASGLSRNRHKSLKTVSQTWDRACCVWISSLWTQIKLVSSYLEKKHQSEHPSGGHWASNLSWWGAQSWTLACFSSSSLSKLECQPSELPPVNTLLWVTPCYYFPKQPRVFYCAALNTRNIPLFTLFAYLLLSRRSSGSMKERTCLSSSWTSQVLGQRPCEKAPVLTLKMSTVLSFLIKADVTLSRLCIRHAGFSSPPLTQRVVCSLPHQPLPGRRRPPPGPSHVPSGLTTACPRSQLLDYVQQEAFREARTPGGGVLTLPRCLHAPHASQLSARPERLASLAWIPVRTSNRAPNMVTRQQ